ncbi:MAG: nitroreductase family protein [Granulosicoccus sp.]
MKNISQHPIHELFTQRWSPYAFDSNKPVSTEDLQSLFEAARWAMSAYNAQPWRYIVANRNTDESLWNQILSTLVDGNQPWATHAPVLALGLVQTEFEQTGKPNTTAIHDLGASSAFLTIEATARGLSVHQMSGILPDAVRSTFNVPDQLKPVTGLAIGYAGANPELDENYAQRDERLRERKSMSEILVKASL